MITSKWDALKEYTSFNLATLASLGKAAQKNWHLCRRGSHQGHQGKEGRIKKVCKTGEIQVLKIDVDVPKCARWRRTTQRSCVTYCTTNFILEAQFLFSMRHWVKSSSCKMSQGLVQKSLNCLCKLGLNMWAEEFCNYGKSLKKFYGGLPSAVTRGRRKEDCLSNIPNWRHYLWVQVMWDWTEQGK